MPVMGMVFIKVLTDDTIIRIAFEAGVVLEKWNSPVGAALPHC